VTAAEEGEKLQRARVQRAEHHAVEDGPRFKCTRRKLDALRGGLGQRPKAREPSIGEQTGDCLRHIKNRWYHWSILKKWNEFLGLKRCRPTESLSSGKSFWKRQEFIESVE
jgi:hypothetical protein